VTDDIRTGGAKYYKKVMKGQQVQLSIFPPESNKGAMVRVGCGHLIGIIPCHNIPTEKGNQDIDIF